MKIIRSILLLLIITGALVGGVYYAHDNGFVSPKLLNGTPYQTSQWVTDQVDSFLEKQSPTISHIQDVSLESGNVLGDFIQVNEKDQDKRTHEKALEYAQYMYCKQVVEAWEE